MTHNSIEFLEDFLGKNGFWFASCNDFEKLAQESCEKQILQPIESLGVGYPSGNKSYFYVRYQLKSRFELPVGMWNHFVEKIPC